MEKIIDFYIQQLKDDELDKETKKNQEGLIENYFHQMINNVEQQDENIQKIQIAQQILIA